MERWITEADRDGFNIAYVTTPGTFEDVVDLLIPELRRRGLYPEAKPEEKPWTMREKIYGKGQSGLRDDHIEHGTDTTCTSKMWHASKRRQKLQKKRKIERWPFQLRKSIYASKALARSLRRPGSVADANQKSQMSVEAFKFFFTLHTCT
jgi:hypothetical protein